MYPDNVINLEVTPVSVVIDVNTGEPLSPILAAIVDSNDNCVTIDLTVGKE